MGNMWSRKRAVSAFFFRNQLAMVKFLNCWLRFSQLLYIFSNKLVPSVFLLSLLDVGEVEACGAVVSAVGDVGGGVGVFNFFSRGLLDLIFWEDCSCAIIARASFCQLWHWVMEGLGCNGRMEELNVVIDGDDDGFVGDVGCIFSGHEACPMEVDVMLSFIDKGGEEVEVVVGGVGLDKDNAIVCHGLPLLSSYLTFSSHFVLDSRPPPLCLPNLPIE